jgi:membrane fusion protein, multidrug efflux system
MKYNPILPILVLVLLTACGSHEQTHADADNAIAVEVQKVTLQQIADVITLSGNIEGKTTVKLGFMVPGKIEYIAAKEGAPVVKGQLLSSLEPTNYTIAKELSDVQANAAQDEFDRLHQMYKQGSLSENDHAKASFALQQAKLQQKLQHKNLADTRLCAPLTGILLSKQAEAGEIIAAGTPLFVLADIQNVIVSSFIPEGELHRVTIGQPAEISIAALNKKFTGKVTEVGAIADATSRAFTIKAEIENNGMLIRPGMIAEVRLNGNHSSMNILIPTESIVHDVDNQSYIYVLDDTRHKAFRRKVSLGSMTENKIQVIAGLSAGEMIVTAGQSKLSDGVNITVVK